MAASFDRQENESEKAFAAFSVYLNMGESRSLEAVGQKLGKSGGLIERWSARHQWVERVEAHRAHLAAVELQSQERLTRGKSAEWAARQAEAREDEWAMHRECVEAAREALKRFHEHGRAATLGDIARILEVASKLGRLATGMATDRTEMSGEAGGPIQVELSAALKKIYGEKLATVTEEGR